MPQATFDDVLRFLRHACALGAACELTDGQLLERFVSHREESAFTFLVQRHGPMILGVGRRVLGDVHEAEDVLQATFLILARRTSAIGGKRSIGGWLHGVAQHVALKAKAKTLARRSREREVRTMPSARPVDELTCQELRVALDEAIASLPEKYHAPVVLCYLEGKSYDEAARELGCAKTTLANRLARARELLRRKLVRRGIGLAAGALATTLADMATAAPMPAMLTIKTVKAAGLVAAGKGIAGCLSAGVLTLAEDAMAGMLIAKGKLVAVVLALGLAVGGVGWAGYRALGDQEHPVAARKVGSSALKHAPQKTLTPSADHYGDSLPEFAVSRLGTVRFNHGHRLHSIFFLPDGKTLVSEGSGYVRRWDAVSGKELSQFSTVETWADQSALSPDGKYLTLLSQEDSSDMVRTWDLVKGKEVRTLALPVRRNGGDAWHLNAISPDGRLSAVTMPKQILVFDNADGKKLFTLANSESNQGLAVVFAGNDKLVTADKKQQVQVWDARTGKLIREFGHGAPADVLAASADDSRLATLGHHTYAIDKFLDKDLVHVWDLNTGNHLHALPAPPKSWYMDVRFSPDGKMLFASSTGEKGAPVVIVWDIVTGNKIRELGEGYARAVSPDGSRVAVGWQKFNLIDLKSGHPSAFAESRHSLATQVFLSPATDRAYTISPFSVSEWNVANGQLLHAADLPYFGNSSPRRTHSPDGHYALSFEGDYKDVQIIVWDVVARKALQRLAPPGADYSMKTVFSPNSKLLATYRMGEVRIWEIATGKEVRFFKDTKSGWWGTPYFTGRGKTLIIAGRDVVGFDIVTGRELFCWRKKGLPAQLTKEVGGKVFKQPDPSAWRTIVISPDGKTAAGILLGGYSRESRTENRIVLSEAKTGAVLRQMDDSGIAASRYESVCFSADSRLLASSNGDIVHLWETATGKEVRALRGHRGDIMSLSFGANGRRLASSSNDSTCLIWDLVLAAGGAEPLTNAPGEKDVAAWWADLASNDPRQGYAAIWRLAGLPKTSVAFLSQQLHAVSQSDAKQISQQIANLGSETFAVRKKSFEQLNNLGPLAEPALRRALEANPPLEAQRRLEQLLNNLRNGPMSGEPLRMVRALAVLEHAGTPEAHRLLQDLAKGAPGAWLTDQASAACDRRAIKLAD